ncbi:MAG: carbohydrate kinase family protein [Mycobacteriales bacterium]
MTIGVIGEALVDIFTDVDGAVVERPGGSPFNIAVGAARLGIPTHLLTAVGDDARGKLLRRLLAAEGVDVTQALSLAPTPIATASVDAAGHATYAFELIWDPHFGTDLPVLDALHFGSLGSVIAPGAAEVAAVVDRYRDKALITYDPNWRMGTAIGTPVAFVESNAARSDIVKLSDDDAAAIYPGMTLSEVAKRLLTLGPVLVVITKGAAGAAAWTNKVERHCSAAPAEVIDTVGAGDAFMATLLSELGEMGREKIAALSKREVELVLDFASFVAARTCERVGADPPRLAELF